MKPIYSQLFQTPHLLCNMEQPIVEHYICEPKEVRWKNPKGLTIDVYIDEIDVHKEFKKALGKCEKEYNATKYDYYKIYIRHLYPTTKNLETVFENILKLRERVKFHFNNTSFCENFMVRTLLMDNKYISKNVRRPGVTAKLFRSQSKGRDVLVKTYLYDPKCKSVHYSVLTNFKDEVLFQLYANELQSRRDFICPEIYSWGKFNVVFEIEGHEYKCLYIIMEYIPFVTLKEAVYSTENMTKMYERLNLINADLQGNLLHHNDLHGGNIMVNMKSPLPEIVILDFGEASYGPRKPLFSHLHE